MAPLLLALLALTDAGTQTPVDQFWRNLQGLCGKAFEGRVVDAPAGDTTFAGKRLVIHVRTCTANEIRIPLHVGDDRSRTWVLTRTVKFHPAVNGVRLKHDHRHEDGSEDKITQYGGDAWEVTTATRIEFPADAHTASLIPEAKTNVWTIEVHPGQRFVYALRREGTDRRFRLEFDLTTSVAVPPAPWSARAPMQPNLTGTALREQPQSGGR